MSAHIGRGRASSEEWRTMRAKCSDAAAVDLRLEREHWEAGHSRQPKAKGSGRAGGAQRGKGANSTIVRTNWGEN